MEATRKYLSEREHTILRLLDSPHKFTKEYFHDLRVEIKKLSAFVEMICFNYPRINRKKFFRPWKIVFKKAGRVREMQVEIAVIKQYSGDLNPQFYISHLNNAISFAKKEFSITVDQTLVKKLVEKFNDLHILLSGVPGEKFSSYLTQKDEYIKTLFSQRELKSEEAHELRKQLKIYTYNIAIFSTFKKSVFENFLELVGKWHDLLVVSEQLRAAFENNEIIADDWEALIIIRSNLEWAATTLFTEVSEEYKRISLLGIAGTYEGFNAK